MNAVDFDKLTDAEKEHFYQCKKDAAEIRLKEIERDKRSVSHSIAATSLKTSAPCRCHYNSDEFNR